MSGKRTSGVVARSRERAIGVESVRGVAMGWLSESPDRALARELEGLIDEEGILGFLAIAGALARHELHDMGQNERMFHRYFAELDAARSMRPDPRCEWFASRPGEEQQVWERYALVMAEMLAMDLEDVASARVVQPARWARVMTARDDLEGVSQILTAGEVGATLSGALHMLDVLGERVVFERAPTHARPCVRLSRAMERDPNLWWTWRAPSVSLAVRE